MCQTSYSTPIKTGPCWSVPLAMCSQREQQVSFKVLCKPCFKLVLISDKYIFFNNNDDHYAAHQNRACSVGSVCPLSHRVRRSTFDTLVMRSPSGLAPTVSMGESCFEMPLHPSQNTNIICLKEEHDFWLNTADKYCGLPGAWHSFFHSARSAAKPAKPIELMGST